MKNITLIGMPGSGKSTVGVVLAKTLGYDFLDSDLVIQKKTGKRLSSSIEELGIEGFIELEDQVNSGINVENTVIATGGSAVYGDNAMKHFKDISMVIYLKLPYESIRKRLGDLNKRGVVIREGSTLEDLYKERVPLYEKYADMIVECEGKELREIVEEIGERVK